MPEVEFANRPDGPSFENRPDGPSFAGNQSGMGSVVTTDTGLGYIYFGLTSIGFGSNLISNGADFTGGPPPTGWTAVDCTLAAVAGGEAGNCLEITRTGGALQLGYKTITVTSGKRYRVWIYVKSGTSGNEAFVSQVVTDTGGGNVLGSTSGTSSGTWTQKTYDFTADGGTITIQVLKNTATAGTMLFDSIELYEIMTNGGGGLIYTNEVTERIVNGGFETLGQGLVEHITNGSFETAGLGGTDVFGTWIEESTGGSTIIQDSSTYAVGSKSCRFYHHVAGNYCNIWQTISFVSSYLYKLSFYYKTSVGKQANILICPSSYTGIELKLDGSWQSLINGISLPSSVAWQQVVIYFVGPSETYGNFRITLRTDGDSSAGGYIWWDNVSLSYVDTFDTWIESGTLTGTVTSDVGYSGNYSCKMNTGASSGSCLLGVNLTLSSGKNHRLSFRYKKSDVSAYLTIYYYLYDPYDVYDFITKAWGGDSTEYDVGDSTEWQKVWIDIASHPTRISRNYVLGFKLYGAESGANKSVWLDDVSLFEYIIN